MRRRVQGRGRGLCLWTLFGTGGIRASRCYERFLKAGAKRNAGRRTAPCLRDQRVRRRRGHQRDAAAAAPLELDEDRQPDERPRLAVPRDRRRIIRSESCRPCSLQQLEDRGERAHGHLRQRAGRRRDLVNAASPASSPPTSTTSRVRSRRRRARGSPSSWQPSTTRGPPARFAPRTAPRRPRRAVVTVDFLSRNPEHDTPSRPFEEKRASPISRLTRSQWATSRPLASTPSSVRESREGALVVCD